MATSKGSHSENHRLAYFWDYVARDKVKACPDVSTALPADVASITASESEVPINGGGVKSLIFDQSDEEDPKGVTWGPSFTFAVLVERAEYLRCWNLIRTEPRSFILLRGTKGIGKSVFIYWLIYKITKEAIMNNESLPTFLLISSGGKGRAVYELLCVDVNGLPAVQLVGPGVGADYVLSDVEFDPSVPTKHWNLNVVSYGAREEPKVFIGRVEDAREVFSHTRIFYFYRLCQQLKCSLLFSTGRFEVADGTGSIGGTPGDAGKFKCTFGQFLLHRFWGFGTNAASAPCLP